MRIAMDRIFRYYAESVVGNEWGSVMPDFMPLLSMCYCLTSVKEICHFTLAKATQYILRGGASRAREKREIPP